MAVWIRPGVLGDDAIPVLRKPCPGSLLLGTIGAVLGYLETIGAYYGMLGFRKSFVEPAPGFFGRAWKYEPLAGGM